jgi:putative transposase
MRKNRSEGEVERLMKEAERDIAKGLTVVDACRKLGVAQATFYRWRQRFDPARTDSDRRLRELEGEVERLKRLVVDLMLDNQMLQEVAKKKW